MPVDAGSMYLDLLKRTLTRYDMGDDRHPIRTAIPGVRSTIRILSGVLRHLNLELNRVRSFDPTVRGQGLDHPYAAETMIGLVRLDNLEDCIRHVVADGVQGDLLEAGVWRGGAAIFMRAVLKILDVDDRTVWVADSFAGLPRPDPAVAPDRGDFHHRLDYLAVGLEEVRANFAKYKLLDSQVRFLEGWFSETLPVAPIESLAILRADADMYSSTWDILTTLYSKVSAGGYVIIDDYFSLSNCRQAVDDFRYATGITDPMTPVDSGAVYWRKR